MSIQRTHKQSDLEKRLKLLNLQLYGKKEKLEVRGEKLDNEVGGEKKDHTSHLKNPASHIQPQTSKKCPGWESNPHGLKSPEDFKSPASAIPPPGRPAERSG